MIHYIHLCLTKDLVNDEGLHIATSQRHTVDIFRRIDLFSTVTKTD